MAETDSERGKAIVNVMKSDSMASLGKDYLELGIDAMIESGVLKDIPLVNTVVGLFHAVGTVKDQIFATKLIRFLSQFSETPKNEREEMVDKLNEDSKFAGKFGSALIEILDRMESERKPELAAKCFAAYAKNAISFKHLRQMLFALERIPSFEIDTLRDFSRVTIETTIKLEESTLLAFVNAGLGKNNGGLDGGAILPTELCNFFVSSGVISDERCCSTHKQS